jgi:hypothetical protein
LRGTLAILRRTCPQILPYAIQKDVKNRSARDSSPPPNPLHCACQVTEGLALPHIHKQRHPVS